MVRCFLFLFCAVWSGATFAQGQAPQGKLESKTSEQVFGESEFYVLFDKSSGRAYLIQNQTITPVMKKTTSATATPKPPPPAPCLSSEKTVPQSCQSGVTPAQCIVKGKEGTQECAFTMCRCVGESGRPSGRIDMTCTACK